MGPFALAPLCDPRFWLSLAAYLEVAEHAVQPTTEQRTQLDALNQAAAKGMEDVRSTCTAEIAITPTGRLEAIDTRLSSVLQAVKTVRPALDSFYASLSDEQKARLNTLSAEPERGGRRRGRR